MEDENTNDGGREPSPIGKSSAIADNTTIANDNNESVTNNKMDDSTDNVTAAPLEKEVKRRGGRASMNRGPLTEKQECPDCNKMLSKHSLIYNTHKCAAKSRKQIVIENIASPVETSKKTASAKEATPQLQQPQNYIDLDGDIDYDHQHVHNLVHGYFRHSKDKDRAYKQEKFRNMLAGRL
jgi:hypothetical protein